MNLWQQGSLKVVAYGHRGDTLRNSLPSTIAAYPHSHGHLLVATNNATPTSTINRDSVDQYCGVVVRTDDVEHVQFIASRVALGQSTSECRCRRAPHTTGLNDKQGGIRPNRTHKGGRVGVLESVPRSPLSRDKGRVGLAALLPLRCRRFHAGWLLAKRSSGSEGENHWGESRVAHGRLRRWIAFSAEKSRYIPSPP